MAQLDIDRVRKFYGRNEVLHGVDLRVPNGSFAVIVGPSGCGKSTLLRMVAGLEEISAGEIRIDGHRVNEKSPRDRGCAMVFQNYALYPHMSVAQNIAYPLKIAGVRSAERERRVKETADLLELGALLDRRPGQLSGGQRQRVAMGRAIVRHPHLFLFDEPLSNLDAKLRVQMRIEIRRLHRRIGTTSIFVTHDQTEAMTMADLLVVMNDGRIEQIGSPTDIYRSPATTFVASFLGAPPMNLLSAAIIEDGRMAICGDSGQQLTAPRGLGESGEEVAVGIRPEDIVISDASDAIALTVDMVEELGSGRIAYANLSGSECAVALPASTAVSAGTVLKVRFPRERLHFFNARSGRRTEPADRRVAA